MDKELVPFDYSKLPEEQEEWLQQATTDIKKLMNVAGNCIVEIGRLLNSAKETVGHGHFRQWIATEFEWSESTAWKYMRIATSFGESVACDTTSLRALYLLSGPLVPEEARDEAIERIEAGENITEPVAREIIEEHTADVPPRKTEAKPLLCDRCKNRIPIKDCPDCKKANADRRENKKGGKKGTSTEPANGQELYRIKSFDAAYGALLREIDDLGNVYGAKESTEARGLRRLLKEYHEVFMKWHKALSIKGKKK